MTFSLNLPTPIPNIPTHTTTPLYLILDGSQIEELDKTLLSQGLSIQAVCPTPLLFLRSVSPIITPLTPESLKWFLGYDKANHGYIVQSPLDERELAEKLQDYYQVITPYGSEVFFKVGQPEMLSVLLSNLKVPLWQYLNTVWLPTRTGWHTLSRDEEITHFDTLKEDGYHFSDKQWQLIEEKSELNNTTAIHQYLTEYYSSYLNAFKYPYESIHSKIKEINQYGIHETSDLTCYFSILAMLNVDILKTEKYPEITQLITTPSAQTPSQRISLAWELTEKTITNVK